MSRSVRDTRRHGGPGPRGQEKWGRARDRDAEKILALVSAHDAVSAALLLHRSRCRAPVARSRQLAMYLMHTSLGRTMADVGRYFGRDRTTVAHACGRIEDQRDDAGFDALVLVLEERIAARPRCAVQRQVEQNHVRH